MFNPLSASSAKMALPPMLLKSNMSMLSASILVASPKRGCWNSSVHCSYYSLLQMMIHLLIDVKQPPLSIEDLLNKSKGDSHKRILEALLMEIKSKNEMVSFSSGFEKIRRMRVKADYKPELFEQDKCLEVKQQSESLRDKAISYFKAYERDKK